MVGEIKTIEERKDKLLALGKKQGFVTYEQLADELKGLDIDSDTLDELYNARLILLQKMVVMMLLVKKLLKQFMLKN